MSRRVRRDRFPFSSVMLVTRRIGGRKYQAFIDLNWAHPRKIRKPPKPPTFTVWIDDKKLENVRDISFTPDPHHEDRLDALRYVLEGFKAGSGSAHFAAGRHVGEAFARHVINSVNKPSQAFDGLTRGAGEVHADAVIEGDEVKRWVERLAEGAKPLVGLTLTRDLGPLVERMLRAIDAAAEKKEKPAPHVVDESGFEMTFCGIPFPRNQVVLKKARQLGKAMNYGVFLDEVVHLARERDRYRAEEANYFKREYMCQFHESPPLPPESRPDGGVFRWETRNDGRTLEQFQEDLKAYYADIQDPKRKEPLPGPAVSEPASGALPGVPGGSLSDGSVPSTEPSGTR